MIYINLTSTKLKLIALATMLLDHICRFLPGMPFFFHWIGRISAPLFIYCCVQGFIHTECKLSYLRRLYLFSLLMGIVNYILDFGDESLNFIRTLFLIAVILFLIDKFQSRDKYAPLYLLLFTLWQIFASIIIIFLAFNTNLEDKIIIFVITAFSSVIILDGGIIFIFIGVAMYLCRNSKNKFAISFFLITCLYIFIYNTNTIETITNMLHYSNHRTANLVFINTCNMFLGIVHPAFLKLNLLHGNPQWMMIFSLPFIYVYNEENGKGLKHLFYLFYPLHIIILYFIRIQFF